MSFHAEVLRVLIASPSDVRPERDEIEKAVFDWNSRFAEQLKVVLLPSRWENDVAPSYNTIDSQEIINQQLVNKCDILIGVFWTKLGTPTTKHSSGTLEEINLFIDQNKEVMVYFLDKDLPRNTDFDEVRKVDAYKAEYGKKGVYASYNPSKIIDHLYKKVVNYKKQNRENSQNDNVRSVPHADQSRSETLESRVHIEQLIVNDKLTKLEILMLAYILDTGNRNFGFRWMAEETLEMIKSWEAKNLLSSELHTNYNGIITNLTERRLLVEKEYTSHNNVRLYMMPMEVYDQLRALSTEVKERINEVVNSFKYPF